MPGAEPPGKSFFPLNPKAEKIVTGIIELNDIN